MKNNIQLEVLSPVHIGGASENHFGVGMDVFWKNGVLYRVDLKDLASFFDDRTISMIATASSGKDIQQLMFSKGLNVKEVAKESWDCHYQPEQDEIKALIRDGFGKRLIPGSSIKGALRSHLFKSLAQANSYDFDHLKQRIKREEDSRRAKRPVAEFEKGILELKIEGNSRKTEYLELLRFLQVSDFSFDSSEIHPVKIYNLSKDEGRWAGAWKDRNSRGNRSESNNNWEFSPRGFVTHYEVIDKHQQSSGRIVFNEPPEGGGFRTSHQTFKREFGALLPNGKMMLNDLFAMVNQNTLDYIDQELAFFKKYVDDDFVADNQIVPFYERLKEQVAHLKNACILRVGGGSGFHSITGNWLYKDHIESVERPLRLFMGGRIKNLTKSRKLTFQPTGDELPNFQPMGFIKLSIQSI
jgi:CRISPR/Cas system CSM-associated protein Csm5 (group 7 of RAMP superfamily)